MKMKIDFYKIRIKSLVFTVLAICVAAALCGCTQYTDLASAEAANARLGESIVIDGVDVSGMDIPSARAALEANAAKRAARIRFTLTAGEEQVQFDGGMLMLYTDADAVLLNAVNLKRHYPAGNPSRSFETSFYTDMEGLRAALTPIAETLTREPEQAMVSFDGAFEYTPEQSGFRVDVAKLASRVAGILTEGEHMLVAQCVEIPAEYTLEQAEADTVLISEFTTSFAGSTYGKANRVFNIAKAAMLINGSVVQPGESFSMNFALGDRNSENGWRQATAIRDGVYTSEYGGGVCQVSTTLYNAALLADLYIVERHHHSWPLGYVDIGRDATISTGGPDLVLQNSSDAPLYIQAWADEEEKTVTVRLYGRHSTQWASIALTSSRVQSLDDPGDELVLDESLPYGSRVEDRASRGGSVAETYRTYLDADGNVLDKQLVSRDKYRPIKGIVRLSADLYYGQGAAAYDDTSE